MRHFSAVKPCLKRCANKLTIYSKKYIVQTVIKSFEGILVVEVQNKGRLEGRTALVTGASGALGKEIALAMGREGADVAVHYMHTKEPADHIVDELTKLGRKAYAVQADIAKYEDTERMKFELDRDFGKINILVNNAGINRDTVVEKMSVDQWRQVLGVNLDGYFHCIKAFVNDLSAMPNGRIINITSIVGQTGNIGQSNYAASKAGIIGLTKALAKELARKGVTVNAVAPGFIDSPMVAGVPDKVKEKVLLQIPMRRFGKPEEVAYAVVYLASVEANYITGHILNINGGMYIFEPSE
jgi:3-oxoacyl-[acyl-carrier protein] reductase